MNFRNGIGAHLDDQANTTLGRHWGSILSILDRTDGTVDRVTITGEREEGGDEGDEEEGEDEDDEEGVEDVGVSAGSGGQAMTTRRSTRGSPKGKKAPVAAKKAEGSKGKGREDSKADHTAKKVFDVSKHAMWAVAVSPPPSIRISTLPDDVVLVHALCQIQGGLLRRPDQ
jgi:hypothetical protein